MTEFDLAEACLNVVAAWYDDEVDHPELAAEDSPRRLPARRLVCIGLPAADCESLQVSIESVTPIDANVGVTALGADNEVTGYMRAVNLGLWLMRCVPGLDDQANPPAAEDETASALLITGDRVEMEAALHEALDNGELPGCGALAFVEWQSITPEGYIGGGVLRIICSLE